MVEEAKEILFAVRTRESAKIDPGFTRAVVLGDPSAHGVWHRVEQAARGHVGGKAWLREHGDVRSGAGFGVDDDLLLEAVRARVDHLGTGCICEIGDDRAEDVVFGLEPGAGDRHGLTGQIGRTGSPGVEAIPAERTFARSVLQVAAGHCARRERKRRHTGVK